MSRYKKFNLYHALKKRTERKFIKNTIATFFSGISSCESLDFSIHFIALCISLLLVYFFNLGFIWWMILDSAILAIITLTISIVDSYFLYKIKVRKNGRKSIATILGIQK